LSRIALSRHRPARTSGPTF